MQSNSQQSHQLQRDLISPSPYQCHMSVRSGPLTPTASSASTPSIAAATAAAYDSIGLIASGASTSTNNVLSSGSAVYSSARHSPCSPSQSSSNLYPLNSNPPTPFGISNSTGGSTGNIDHRPSLEMRNVLIENWMLRRSNLSGRLGPDPRRDSRANHGHVVPVLVAPPVTVVLERARQIERWNDPAKPQSISFPSRRRPRAAIKLLKKEEGEKHIYIF